MRLFKRKQKELTLAEARELLNQNIENGYTCPCCNRYTKIYKRVFNTGMAYFLSNLYKKTMENKVGFYCANEIVNNTKGLDYGVLVHFGVIKKVGKSSYAITKKGIEFIEGKAQVSKYVILQNNKLVDCVGELSFKDAWKEKFDIKNI